MLSDSLFEVEVRSTTTMDLRPHRSTDTLSRAKCEAFVRHARNVFTSDTRAPGNPPGSMKLWLCLSKPASSAVLSQTKPVQVILEQGASILHLKDLCDKNESYDLCVRVSRSDRDVFQSVIGAGIHLSIAYIGVCGVTSDSIDTERWYTDASVVCNGLTVRQSMFLDFVHELLLFYGFHGTMAMPYWKQTLDRNVRLVASR